MPKRKRPSKAKFCPERIKDPKLFDERSFRTKVYRAHRITFGCPKGKWDDKLKVCKVPVQMQRILHPVGEGVCPIPGIEVKKTRKKNSKKPCPMLNPKKISQAEKEAVKLFIKGIKGDDIIKILKDKYKLTANWAKYVLSRAQRMARGVLEVPKTVKKITRVGVGGILVPKSNEFKSGLEKEAVRLWSMGYGKESISEELQRRFKVRKGQADYYANRAGRIGRGQVKYVSPSVHKILTNFINRKKR